MRGPASGPSVKVSRTSVLLLILCVLPISWAQDYADISVDGAYDLLVGDPTIYLLDVRTPGEYSDGHVSGAFLIPDYEVESRRSELPKDVSAPILVYCRSGARSAASSRKLTEMGFTNVTNMLGGFLAWESKGYPSTVGEERGTFPVLEGAAIALATLSLALGLRLRSAHPKHS